MKNDRVVILFEIKSVSTSLSMPSHMHVAQTVGVPYSNASFEAHTSKVIGGQKKLNKFIQFCQLTGLHPLVAILLFVLDNMLFASGGLVISWPISIPIGIAATIICVLIQKNAMREQWGLAIGKGLFVGLLTAIPTALPAFITAIGGGLGTVALIANTRRSSVD